MVGGQKALSSPDRALPVLERVLQAAERDESHSLRLVTIWFGSFVQVGGDTDSQVRMTQFWRTKLSMYPSTLSGTTSSA